MFFFSVRELYFYHQRKTTVTLWFEINHCPACISTQSSLNIEYDVCACLGTSTVASIWIFTYVCWFCDPRLNRIIQPQHDFAIGNDSCLCIVVKLAHASASKCLCQYKQRDKQSTDRIESLTVRNYVTNPDTVLPNSSNPIFRDHSLKSWPLVLTSNPTTITPCCLPAFVRVGCKSKFRNELLSVVKTADVLLSNICDSFTYFDKSSWTTNTPTMS